MSVPTAGKPKAAVIEYEMCVAFLPSGMLYKIAGVAERLRLLNRGVRCNLVEDRPCSAAKQPESLLAELTSLVLEIAAPEQDRSGAEAVAV